MSSSKSMFKFVKDRKTKCNRSRPNTLTVWRTKVSDPEPFSPPPHSCLHILSEANLEVIRRINPVMPVRRMMPNTTTTKQTLKDRWMDLKAEISYQKASVKVTLMTSLRSLCFCLHSISTLQILSVCVRVHIDKLTPSPTLKSKLTSTVWTMLSKW